MQVSGQDLYSLVGGCGDDLEGFLDHGGDPDQGQYITPLIWSLS